MSNSSETPSQSTPTDRTKVIFAVLSTYERHGWVHPSILQFFAELPFNPTIAYRMVPVHNFIPAAAGRNFFCKNYKDADMDWICMIDNDMALPMDFLDSIKGAPADASIVVPEFYMWSQHDLKLTLCWGKDDCPTGKAAKLKPGFHELTKCGTGAIFIKPEVFRRIPYPYFRYVFDDDGGIRGTEDIQFCLSAREMGFKIYGNTQVKVGHYHSVEIGSMWRWRDKTLDNQDSHAVSSAQKDLGRSPKGSADARSAKAS